MILGTIVSSLYVHEFNPSNNFLSLYFIVPVVVVFFSRIRIPDEDYLAFFLKVITVILIANNIIALFQLIKNPSDDDSFNGFYGTHGLGLHTLSIVNFIVSFYYFIFYNQNKRKKYLILGVFFLVSAVLCFYGLGLVVFLCAFFFYRFSLRTFFRSIIVFAVLIGLVGGSLYLFRPQTFLYNYENIRRIGLFLDPDANPKLVSRIPRKLVMHKNYIDAYSQDVGLFLLGSGPGTFNSRSYFLLNGEYSRSQFLERIFGTHNPHYAAKYIYPLWNKENTGQYMDGTRNEPFSSVIALLAEYGFVMAAVLFMLTYSKYKRLIRNLRRENDNDETILRSKFLKFVTIFMTLNLFTDNFLEYPEIVIIYLLLFKLIEIASPQFYESNKSTKQTIAA